jgi:hypothetical protein
MDRQVFFGAEQLDKKLIQSAIDIPVDITEIIANLIFPVIQKIETGPAPPGNMLPSIGPFYPLLGKHFELLQLSQKIFIQKGFYFILL